jgi:hypothetical protein
LTFEQVFTGVLRRADDGSMGFDAILSLSDQKLFKKPCSVEIRSKTGTETASGIASMTDGVVPARLRIVLNGANELSVGSVVEAVVSIVVGDEDQVLSVPESAVVDRGRERLVYVETMPGLFDGVSVELGRRCGAYYPVVKGLKSGQRVASAGAFLIDAETGRILYTVHKEPDFGASLRSGPLVSTSLAAAFLEAVGSGRRDAVAYGPFARYFPSCMQPASFLAVPLFDGRKLIGVVAFQIPIDRANEIIGETTGMGKTGETYAIGPDRMFRSNSRFAADLGVASTIINPDFKVDTTAVKAALEDGKAGTAVGQDYRGKAVLSSWMPVTIHRDDASDKGTVRWALISEIDEAEVMRPIRRLRDFALTIFGVTTAGVLVVSSAIARRLTRESVRQAALVSGQVQGGFLNSTVAVPQIRAGALRGIAVADATRWRELPELPTTAELGYPAAAAISWYGILAPAGLPPALRDRLAGDLRVVLARPAVREKILAAGLDPLDVGPEPFAAQIAAETVRWAGVVQAAGIKPD